MHLILTELLSVGGGHDVDGVLVGWDEMFMGVFVLLGGKSAAADHKILLISVKQ